MIADVRKEKMKYQKQQLDDAITQMKLSENNDRSLRGLVSLRRQPQFLGYFVKIVGMLVLAVAIYSMYLMIHAAFSSPHLQAGEYAKIADPLAKTSGTCFLLALFLLHGAEQYLKRTRESLAVCELLMKKTNHDLATTEK